MRKVPLRLKEQYTYELVKQHVEQNGNFKRLVLKLNCSERSARRKIAGYKAQGKAFFLHGNRDRKPVTTISEETKTRILSLYAQPQYEGANFKHFHELLQRLHPEIPSVSLSALRRIFQEAGVLSPKAWRSTKKKLRECERMQARTTGKIPQSESVSPLPLDPFPHPRRAKSRYAGELLFMDASIHHWFGDSVHSLHAVIDDATGIVMGAWFEEQETLEGYYQTLAQVLRNYGIPFRIQTDGRSVFEYAAFKIPKSEKDTATQFGYACKQLGVDLQTTSCAQHQGKVERLFQTFQSRLVVELKVRNIETKEGANQFLHVYLPQYNEQFATPYSYDTPNVFAGIPSEETINLTLAVLCKRIVDNGNCIQFRKQHFRFLNKKGEPVYLRKNTKVLVIEALDKQLFASCREQVFALEVVPEHQHISREFDLPVPKKERVVYIPPPSHPWKEGVFTQFEADRIEHVYKFDELYYTTENVFGKLSP